jgi:NADH-quinone oxidoreductase subunit M
MLWLYQRVFYGQVDPEVLGHVGDLSLREWAAVLPLIVMMVWMGVYSQSFLPPVSRNTARVLEQTNVNVPYRVRLWDRPPGLSSTFSISERQAGRPVPLRSWPK